MTVVERKLAQVRQMDQKEQQMGSESSLWAIQ